jgi:hypothetical protein
MKSMMNSINTETTPTGKNLKNTNKRTTKTKTKTLNDEKQQHNLDSYYDSVWTKRIETQRKKTTSNYDSKNGAIWAIAVAMIPNFFCGFFWIGLKTKTNLMDGL